MRLWLVLRNPPTGAIAPPTACPRAGCDGRRFRLHQTVGKRVRRAPGVAIGPGVAGTVAARRYRCLSCRRTFRVYANGIDRGIVPVVFKRFAAALRWLGLPVRDISRALDVLGMPLGKSQVHVAVGAMVRGLCRRSRQAAPLFGRVEIEHASGNAEGGVDGERRNDRHSPTCRDGRTGHLECSRDEPAATIEIGGRRLPLRRAVDWAGRPALVIEGIDSRVRAIVERTVRPVLAGFGVIAEVDYSEPGRSSLDEMFGSGRSSSSVFGADQVDQVEDGGAAESVAGESGAGVADGSADEGASSWMTTAAGAGPPGARGAGTWVAGRGESNVPTGGGTGRRARCAGVGAPRGALLRGVVRPWVGRELGIGAIVGVAGFGDWAECRDRGAELVVMGC